MVQKIYKINKCFIIILVLFCLVQLLFEIKVTGQRVKYDSIILRNPCGNIFVQPNDNIQLKIGYGTFKFENKYLSSLHYF